MKTYAILFKSIPCMYIEASDLKELMNEIEIYKLEEQNIISITIV